MKLWLENGMNIGQMPSGKSCFEDAELGGGSVSSAMTFISSSLIGQTPDA